MQIIQKWVWFQFGNPSWIYHCCQHYKHDCSLFTSGIPTWNFRPNINIKLPIPRTTICSQVIFIWPKLVNYNGENCFCLPYETSIYSFNDCAREYGSDYSATLEGDSIVFLSPTSGEILVHFVCDESPCEKPQYCGIQSIIASHRLVISKY